LDQPAHPQVERTVVTKHDSRGRVLEFEREELEVPVDERPTHSTIKGVQPISAPAVQRLIREQVSKALTDYTPLILKSLPTLIQPALDRRAMMTDVGSLRVELARLQARVQQLEAGGSNDATVVDMRGRLGKRP
jgi:hypothetical protein